MKKSRRRDDGGGRVSPMICCGQSFSRRGSENESWCCCVSIDGDNNAATHCKSGRNDFPWKLETRKERSRWDGIKGRSAEGKAVYWPPSALFSSRIVLEFELCFWWYYDECRVRTYLAWVARSGREQHSNVNVIAIKRGGMEGDNVVQKCISGWVVLGGGFLVVW